MGDLSQYCTWVTAHFVIFNNLSTMDVYSANASVKDDAQSSGTPGDRGEAENHHEPHTSNLEMPQRTALLCKDCIPIFEKEDSVSNDERSLHIRIPVPQNHRLYEYLSSSNPITVIRSINDCQFCSVVASLLRSESQNSENDRKFGSSDRPEQIDLVVFFSWPESRFELTIDVRREGNNVESAVLELFSPLGE